MNFRLDSKEDALDALYHYQKYIPIKCTEDALNKSATYLWKLWSFNSSYNLVSRKLSPQAILENHFLDCCLCLNLLPRSNRIADLGSGGGFPGIIWAIFFPKTQVSLYEKSSVKNQFLTQLKDFIPNINVEGTIPSDKIEADLITARAFKPISVICRLTKNNLKLGTPYFLLKARRQKIEEELAATSSIKTNIQILSVPHPILDVERHIVSF